MYDLEKDTYYGWLRQAGVDFGQLAVAARKYDDDCAAKFRLLSEILLWNADRVRTAYVWADKDIYFYPCAINSKASSFDEIELESGKLTGGIYDSINGIMNTMSRLREKVVWNSAMMSDSMKESKEILDNSMLMLIYAFPMLVFSGLNSIGKKLAIETKKEFKPYEYPMKDAQSQKPLIAYCPICGTSYIGHYEKCVCGAGWNTAKFWT